MDSIERQILNRYQEREESKTYYDLVQKVKPNPQTFKITENRSQNVVTEKGVVRMRGRQRRFLSNRGLV